MVDCYTRARICVGMKGRMEEKPKMFQVDILRGGNNLRRVQNWQTTNATANQLVIYEAEPIIAACPKTLL